MFQNLKHTLWSTQLIMKFFILLFYYFEYFIKRKYTKM